jgi:ABC-type branched-subunit amino acid transport system ATPase component
MAVSPILEIVGVSQRFGGLTAVDGCSWSLEAGAAAAIIGPNGAGKSTLVDLISGTLPLQTGRITFNGDDISRWPAHRIARSGLIRTFQIARDFERLTAVENMLVAPTDQPGESVWRALLRPRSATAAETAHLDRALHLLETFELYAVRNNLASELSGGQRRLLELARAMMARPKVLILDEPTAGVSPVLLNRISEHLVNLRADGVTLLLIEHNLSVVEQVCDRVTVTRATVAPR